MSTLSQQATNLVNAQYNFLTYLIYLDARCEVWRFGEEISLKEVVDAVNNFLATLENFITSADILGVEVENCYLYRTWSDVDTEPLHFDEEELKSTSVIFEDFDGPDPVDLVELIMALRLVQLRDLKNYGSPLILRR